MSSNNHGVVVKVETIGKWLYENWDQSRPCYMLTIEDHCDIPDLMEIEATAEVVDGGNALVFIREHETRNIEVINWGNGHMGVCCYDGEKLTYITPHTEQPPLTAREPEKP